MRWIAGLCAVGVLLAVAVAGSAAGARPAGVSAAAFEPAVPKVCKKKTALADFGEAGSKCVKAGQACNRKRNAPYARIELKCVRKTIRKGRKRVRVYRLRKLTGPERRFGAPARAAPNGRIPLDVALAAFEKAFGVDLPGFKAPKGLVGSFEDGTAPLLWAQSYRKDLTGAQRKAVDRVLTPRSAPVRKTQAQAPMFTQTEIEAVLATVKPWVASYMGQELTGDTPVVLQADDDPKTAAFASPQFGESGAYSGCFVVVTPRGQGYKNLAYGERALRALLAHELVHCHQGQLVDSKWKEYKWGADTSWIVEGFARFAALEMIAANDPGESLERKNAQQVDSKAFLEHPEVPVIQRGYDAGNFWQMLADAGIAPVEAQKQALAAFKGGAKTAQIYDVVTAFAGSEANERLLFEAGPAFLRRADWGPVFDIRGEGVHPTATPANSEEVEIANDSGAVTVAASPHAFAARRLSLTADFISVQSLPGTRGRLHASGGSNDGLAIDDALYTTLDDPKCPNGNPVPGIAAKILAGEAGIGISGGPESATVAIKGQSLNSLCDAPEEKPCKTLCEKPKGKGGSNGDPHLTSMDGLHYDFQAAGEFLLLRSGSDLEIQARQQALPKSKDVTINTQFGIRAGQQRVTVSPSGSDSPAVRLDGNLEPLPLDEPRTVPGGATLTRSGRGQVQVTWADGSRAEFRAIGTTSNALTVEIALSPTRTGKTTGMLGNFDGSLANDLVGRDGRKVPYTLRPDDGWQVRRGKIKEEYTKTFSERLYKSWGESWRISQAKSLFDYGSGQTTATFTNRTIPRKVFDPDNLEGRADAERICREAGVTDSGPLEDCILDVLISGDPAFAQDALLAQEAGRTWTELPGGDGFKGIVNLAVGGDGLLHAAFARDPGDGGEVPSSIPIDAQGVAGARETISGSPGRPSVFTASDGGMRAVTGETGVGIRLHARGGGGSWASQALVTDAAGSFYDYPTAIEAPGGALVTAAPGSSDARLYVGTGAGNGGVQLATSGNCTATSPALAVDSGQVWVAWAQSRSGCELPGMLVQQFDPAAKSLVGSPQVAPGSGTGLSVDDRVAFTGRPGQAGLFVAFAADGGDNARVWQVGSGASSAIPKQAASVRNVRIAPAPQGGRLWIAWHESDSTRRIWVQQVSADGTPEGAPRGAAPPPGTTAGVDDFRIVDRSGQLEIVAGALGRLWYRRLDG